MKYDQVAVDASFLLKIFLPENKSDQAEELWKSWVGDHVEIMAPTLITFEVSSMIRNKVFRDINTPNLYDCFYLALPRLLRIPLWTADKKLFRSAKKEFPFVNLL